MIYGKLTQDINTQAHIKLAQYLDPRPRSDIYADPWPRQYTDPIERAAAEDALKNRLEAERKIERNERLMREADEAHAALAGVETDPALAGAGVAAAGGLGAAGLIKLLKRVAARPKLAQYSDPIFGDDIYPIQNPSQYALSDGDPSGLVDPKVDRNVFRNEYLDSSLLDNLTNDYSGAKAVEERAGAHRRQLQHEMDSELAHAALTPDVEMDPALAGAGVAAAGGLGAAGLIKLLRRIAARRGR